LTSNTLASDATLTALEFAGWRAMIAALAGSDLGSRSALAMLPATDPAELESRRERYSEAERLRLDGALAPPLGDGLAELLARLGGVHPPLGGPDLLRVVRLLETSRAASERIRAAQPVCPALAALAAPLGDPAPLVRAAGRVLDRKGRVRDDASPRLVELRREIQRSRDAVYRELETVRGRHREWFEEESSPLRGGRVLLLLEAGARGKVGGLVHGRSATGRSLYFEPLEAVEWNNSLEQASAEDEAERQRLLAELVTAFRAELPLVEAHSAFVAELDRLEALLTFARLADARLARIGERELRLVGARHPLLEPRLADLRERALGEGGHRGAIVPLDLALGGERRTLVVTGPNAGGKTVALKTVGLVSLVAQCGAPVTAAAGTSIPFFLRVVAAVGDDQDLLRDRSTFSGRLLRLGEAWSGSGADSLVLVDELGSGTDPEEGTAIARALVERLAGRGGLALITTHLVGLAAAALELPGAGCAAMEFDPASGQPTYRLRPGAPGGSEALALARRLGLPAPFVDRAEALLGSEHRDLRRLLSEVEAGRAELARATGAAEESAAQARARLEALERERAALAAERRGLAARQAREIQEFRERVQRQLAGELERLRGELEAGRRRNLVGEAAKRLFAAAPQAEAAPDAGTDGEPQVGDRVRHRALGWLGHLDRREGERAEVRVGGKRLTCAVGELVRVAAGAPVATPEVPPHRRRSAVESDVAPEAPAELQLLGARVEDGLAALDEFLDRALRTGRSAVRVVHGHGTGRLRDAIRDHLRRHPAVASLRPGEKGEGGNGATVVELEGR
jgi:DNA mismatch repair protein MutS2